MIHNHNDKKDYGAKMKKIFILCVIQLFLIFIGHLTESAFAQEVKSSKMPSQVLFNGYLSDKEGRNLADDNYNFIIHVYDSPDAQLPLWSGKYENVEVKDGLFTIMIGSDEENTLSFDKKYYLGIQVNDEAEMPQRLELGTTAYSLGAKYANTVRDGSITTEKLKDGSITSDKIKSLSFSKIIDPPADIRSIEDFKNKYGVAGSDYDWWTWKGNIIYGPERHFIGTRNARDFLIQTNEIDRMRFDPFGYILLGTGENPVDFEVFGYSIFDYWFVDGNLGVGIDPAGARMHIAVPPNKNPLRVDYLANPILTIDSLGRVEITSSVTGNDDDKNAYALSVKGGQQGIGIDINTSVNGDNNYVSFWDGEGMVGRIEGQTAGEYLLQPKNIATDAYLAALVVAEVVAASSWLYPLPIPTEPADIIRIASDIAEITFKMIWDLANLGVTYESGSGDYAEWLERIDLNETIFPGDIVGVNGGKISKNTFNAENLMAISTSPIVLGNMPLKTEENKFEKVAFMGQVPIKVSGEVNCGDFIIPSGLNDGTGIAVSPELITIDELDKIVGRTWSESNVESVKMVNVLVGVNSTDIGQVLRQNRVRENISESRIKTIDAETSLLKSKIQEIRNTIRKINENTGSDKMINMKKASNN
ncbi:MAG: hypothetical protein C4539_03815 [Ignavibacteriales bacterium]|nr:MAG: hypothetical protein C4539_03815 [Ignavibacteriales bacterium]